MTEIFYTIQWAVNGKHHLKKGEITLGFFDTYALALEGLERAVRPVIANFDETGDPC